MALRAKISTLKVSLYINTLPAYPRRGYAHKALKRLQQHYSILVRAKMAVIFPPMPQSKQWHKSHHNIYEICIPRGHYLTPIPLLQWKVYYRTVKQIYFPTPRFYCHVLIELLNYNKTPKPHNLICKLLPRIDAHCEIGVIRKAGSQGAY